VLEELSTPGLGSSALQILHPLISWQTPKAGCKHITLFYAFPETYSELVSLRIHNSLADVKGYQQVQILNDDLLSPRNHP